jgi:hypothetical protein
VLRPEATRVEEAPVALATEPENAVNKGLEFRLGDFAGYSVELESEAGADEVRRTRISYRLIRTLGDEPLRIERYLESETTRRSGPFQTQQTVRRERLRTIVAADDLRPLTSRGETTWWTDDGWISARHQLAFEDSRVRGLVSDSAGGSEELDREVPRGIVLREMTDLAFALLAADSLLGRSVEFVTFDPRTGVIASDRYDVQGVENVEVGGRRYQALRVNIASDLTNTIVHFRRERPRVLLRRANGDDGTEAVSRLDVFER